jgi:hypothetical protein
VTLPEEPVTWLLVLIIGTLSLTLLLEMGALALMWLGWL